ncbi:MAG TPA: rod shape-determining protein RodA [Verrucomicrobiota bacterium]|jgi:rod shape determining protein RodA|nr:rod shape-determining protein RodA [Verrucomicrobiota bacterium]OQC24068.1 MAG: Rod shape-determining protein RodA [Verrucomicrobia bacterium ADurb.Bin063]HCL91860.1 rod shape-determining protein RodA [Limisphaerales bacterium]HRR65819.1 rod shape-determining protein RodA [Candidatus Paceibacterota bacterium]MBP8015697.1 rod shape-determining protein RodA [Verrucomicrobiota bacterium]
MFDQDLQRHESRIDRLQIAALCGLMLLGTVFVYSATMVGESAATLVWYKQSWFRQAVWYGLGMGAATAVCCVDYHILARWAMVIYWSAILMLVLVLFFGTVRFGARRWFDLGFFSLQPSEFAKLAFILAQANYLSRPVEELRGLATFWKSLGLMLLPFLLILKEPDLGSALVFLPTGLAILFVAGIPRRYLLRLLGGAGLLGALFVGNVLFAPPNWQIKLEDYQRRRLLVYFGREEAPPPGASRAELARLRQQQADYSHNVRQALISVGSGGLIGKGWRQGTQNALGFLPRPVAHNDFIFSVIAEEKGFVGSVIVITLYGAVLFSGIRIAGQARDRLGKMMAVGVVALIFSHVFINIGMNIRLMPVTGVPLPLLSYGGSSVLGSLIAMGILQNVYFYRRTY